MELCPNFNPLKYSRDVYSSHWGKEADCLHSILFEKRNTPTYIVGVRTAALQLGKQQLSPLGLLAEWLDLLLLDLMDDQINRIWLGFRNEM